MSEDYDPNKALEEYGYSKPGRGKTVVIVLLSILLLAAVGAAGFLGKLWSEEQLKVLAFDEQVKDLSNRISKTENKNAELSSLLADKQAETERIVEEWSAQVETLEKQHGEQLQRTYDQMNEIIYDSRKTLAYISDIEARFRSGQKIDQEEAAQLTGVINGLAFLHQQYGKPLNEFRELDRYFTSQLSSLPADAIDPLETTPLGKRLFKNKEFKEDRAEYFEKQGRRSALVEAKSAVADAYASAQREMAEISLDINQYLTQLQKVVDSNNASAAEVDEFFETSKVILKIHDKIMSLEPPAPPAIQP
jgi:chromosome segregation ATPase